MIRAHRDAVKASLEADLPGSVFSSYSAVKDAKRYAVVWTALSSSPRTRYTGAQSREVYTITVHSLGVDEDSCLWVAERVKKLTGRTLQVAGRRLWPVEFITQRPPDLDDDGPTPLWLAITQFDIVSDPAPAGSSH